MKDIEIAGVLAGALPWLKAFHGQTVVIKYGGHAMTDDALRQAFAEDVVFLKLAGIKPVIVHGGGPQITDMLARLDVPTEFVSGRRVTTPEVMDVVRMVLVGQVQRELVSLINAHGPHAVGVSGEDAHLLTAAARSDELGLVGEITEVRPEFVHTLLEDDLIPIVSTVSRSDDGRTFNVNADSAAAALAVALGAVKLVVLTDVAGLYRDWPTCEDFVHQITPDELRSMLPELDSGMLPKMEACLAALDGGVRRAHVVDGRIPHGVLVEVFTDSGVGTMVVDPS
ncbi:MAG: acetylglutamate kinase [Actinobacteria bacterium]|jgi:acetylglutamate kinase|nr:acetylglutamate kinase [Micrococcales bacterium]MCB0904053.1 acetylglutamate kinase [Actinomycetota bacterium]MCO5299607.1 acetylglutamate kinase [Candidatus Nanopelagicales bacterium]MCB9428316.1 acetylglutamate kinase [Actinomycetota bacterium]HPE11812.1 acetylglutamate kinase [Actinomycetota bacterium]